MDFQALVLTIITSSTITGILVYILKRAIDKKIEIQGNKIAEENKALIQEAVRRQANIFDKQFETLRIALSLAYRLRNTVRELQQTWPEFNAGTNDVITDELHDKTYQYHETIINLLYDNRAILPETIFKLLHEIKHEVGGLRSIYSFIKHEKSKTSPNNEILVLKNRDLQTAYQTLDRHYQVLVKSVHDFLDIGYGLH